MTRPSFRSPSLAALASLSLLFLSSVPLTGCGSSADGQESAGGSPSGTGLSPGGAQDFGRFKAILEAGKLPGPETLDQVGFFAEHKIGTPPTSCADPVCADAQLGAMANMISGSTCTLMHLSLGTPVDPRLQPRPPLDLADHVQLVADAQRLGEPARRRQRRGEPDQFVERPVVERRHLAVAGQDPVEVGGHVEAAGVRRPCHRSA